MPTNANTFNSRVTSEALEAKFRQVFPAQGGAELVQDLFASGVIQPVVDFSTVAEGSVLPVNLQTAWDFSTANAGIESGTATVANNTGFWIWSCTIVIDGFDGGSRVGRLQINDGLGSKAIFQVENANFLGVEQPVVTQQTGVAFLRSGDSLQVYSDSNSVRVHCSARQVATVNGTLVNPLGFTFS